MENEENGLLSSEELAQVSGGSVDEKHTLMHCDECEYETVWIGDFMDDLPYPCEICGDRSMHGIRYI